MTVPTCRRVRCHTGEAPTSGSKMFHVFRYFCKATSQSRLPLAGIFDSLPRLRGGKAASGFSTAGIEAQSEGRL
jgi:hypothetical protein